LLNRQELQAGTVGIYCFIRTEIADWHRVMAFAALFVLPIVLLFVVLQRQRVRTYGGRVEIVYGLPWLSEWAVG